MYFKYFGLTICLLICTVGVEATMTRKDVKQLIKSAKATFGRITAEVDSSSIHTLGTNEGVHGVWNVLENGATCEPVNMNDKDSNCKVTGDTEEIWMSKNALKINYIHKEQTTVNTPSPAKGIDITVVFWGNRNDDGPEKYSKFEPSKVGEVHWVSESKDNKYYDPDYTGLEGNDLNNDYMKTTYNCSDLPEFASLNWIKKHCPNGYDGVLKAIDKIQTVKDITTESTDNPNGLKVARNDTSNYAVILKDDNHYYTEKILEIGSIEHIIDLMNIRTHNINDYTLHVDNFEFSNCSVAYTVKNDTYGSNCRYIYRGGIEQPTDEYDEHEYYINDYTIYSVDLSDVSMILSGVFLTQTFRDYYANTFKSCLALPNKEFIEFSWFNQNCYDLEIDNICPKHEGVISGFEKKGDYRFVGRFALRRSTSLKAYEYKYQKSPISNDISVSADGNQTLLYSVGLVNTHSTYTITKGFNYECYGNQDFISIPPTHGVIGALPYNDSTSKDLEIVYLTKDASVYYRFDETNQITVKLFKQVNTSIYESTYTQYIYSNSVMDDDYSGYDCSSDANVNYFKKDSKPECRCESEFISFNWINTHCSEDTKKHAITDMKAIHKENFIYITKNMLNETVYFADKIENNLPIIRKNYIMTRTTKLEASLKMMVDTHPINDTKVVSIMINDKQGYISDLGFFVVDITNGTTSRVKYDVETYIPKDKSYSYYTIGKLNDVDSGVFITKNLKEILKECAEIPPIYETVLPYKWIKENCQSHSSLMINIDDNILNNIPKKLSIRSYDAVVAHKYGENELIETDIDYKLVDKSKMKEDLQYYEESDYAPIPLDENEGGSSSWNDNQNVGSIITLHITKDYTQYIYLNKRQATTVKILIPSEKTYLPVSCSNGIAGSCSKFTWYKTVTTAVPGVYTSNHLIDVIYDYSGYEGEANRIYFKENYKNCPLLPEFASFRWLQVNCRESIEKMVDPFVARFVGEMNGIYYSKSLAKPHNGTVYINCKENNTIIEGCETHPMIVDSVLNVTKSMLIESSVIPEGNGCKLEEKNLKDRETGERYDLTSYLTDYMVGKKRVVYNLDGSVKLESTLFCMTEKVNQKDSNNNHYTEYLGGSTNYVESKILVNDYVKEVLSRAGCVATTDYIRYEWIYLNCTKVISTLVKECSKENSVLVGQKGTGFIALPINKVTVKKVDETTTKAATTTQGDGSKEGETKYEVNTISNHLFVQSNKVYTIISNNQIFKELGYTAGRYMPIQLGQGAIGKWMTEVDLESLSVTDEALVYEYSLLRKPLTVKIVKFVESVTRGYTNTIYTTTSTGVDYDYSGYENNNANGNYIENKCELTTLPEFISFNWLKQNCVNGTKELIDQMSSRYVEKNEVKIARIVDSIDKANIMVEDKPDVDKLLHIQYDALVKRNQMISTVELPEESSIIVLSTTTQDDNKKVYYGKNRIVYVNENEKCYKQYGLTRSKSGKATKLVKGGSQSTGNCEGDNIIESSIDVALRYEGGINAYKVNNDKIVDTKDVYIVKSLDDVDNEAEKYIEQFNGEAVNPSNVNNDKQNSKSDDSAYSLSKFVFISLSIMVLVTLM